MSPLYYAPGVYVEEVSSGTNPIQAVGTCTTGFVGRTPLADAHVNEAVAIDNWTQFVKEYYKEGAASTPLSHAVFGFFRNGGRRCYVVNIGTTQSLTGSGGRRAGLDVLIPVDEVKLLAIPGMTGAAAYDAALTHCETKGTCFAILDAPEVVSNLDNLTKVATATATTPSRRAGGAPTEVGQPAAPPAPSEGEGGLKPRNSKYGAFYYPWVTVRDPFAPDQLVNVPPSGHLAGIYARVDANRGVHKAPANELIRGALNIAAPVSRADQEMLNPQGVNCIRLFLRDGVMVWGARTLADQATEWKYVNVRRLFNMIEESIGLSTQHVTFEPNTPTLWRNIERDVKNFLTMLWRDGALMGKTAEEAYFVECNAETNPPPNIDLGIVTTRIGIAPVKPAEFVVFRIGQSASGTKVEMEK